MDEKKFAFPDIAYNAALIDFNIHEYNNNIISILTGLF